LLTINPKREKEIQDDKCNMMHFFDKGLDELGVEDLFPSDNDNDEQLFWNRDENEEASGTGRRVEPNYGI
jgi:hypothetical protein